MGNKKQAPASQEPQHDEFHDTAAALNARALFIESALDMGWRLAVAFLAPTLGGLWIDKQFDMSPSATLTGFMIAVVASSMVVYTAVKEADKKVANSFTKPEEKDKQ